MSWWLINVKYIDGKSKEYTYVFLVLMYFTYTVFIPAFISLAAGFYAKHKASNYI